MGTTWTVLAAGMLAACSSGSARDDGGLPAMSTATSSADGRVAVAAMPSASPASGVAGTAAASGASSAAAGGGDAIAGYLTEHAVPEVNAAMRARLKLDAADGRCTDLRAVLAVADDRMGPTLERRVAGELAKTGVLTLAKTAGKRGEIALEAGGWGSKNFKGPNDEAILARCADVDTCRVAMAAVTAPPYRDETLGTAVPFLVCGVPIETAAFGVLQAVADGQH